MERSLIVSMYIRSRAICRVRNPEAPLPSSTVLVPDNRGHGSQGTRRVLARRKNMLFVEIPGSLQRNRACQREQNCFQKVRFLLPFDRGHSEASQMIALAKVTSNPYFSRKFHIHHYSILLTPFGKPIPSEPVSKVVVFLSFSINLS